MDGPLDVFLPSKEQSCNFFCLPAGLNDLGEGRPHRRVIELLDHAQAYAQIHGTDEKDVDPVYSRDFIDTIHLKYGPR